jgi:hypothetical protein
MFCNFTMAMQAFTPTMPRMAPLFTTGDYDLYPLHVCSEDAIAKLFVKICARGNPILQAKPAKDLYKLGAAFYKKSVGTVMGLVFLKGDEPVAMTVGWDMVDGGAWKGTSGPPQSLACHAAIGEAMFASMPHKTTTPGEDVFLAFTGVAVPHPGMYLMYAMQVMIVLTVSGAGYSNLFGYAVHAKTIGQANVYEPNPKGTRHGWRVKFSDIEVADQEVREEILNLPGPGIAECSLTTMGYYLEDTRTHKVEYVREFFEALRPGAARILETPHMPFDYGVQMPMDDGVPMPMARL